jgi:uncharacterized protein YndB with AHSA1/START domain
MANVKTKGLVITREFNAPRKLVFDTITKPEHIVNWWGPKGFKPTVLKMDVRPEGIFHYSIEAGEFKMYGIFVYKEIKSPELLSFVNSFSDEQGNIIRAPMSDTWPLEIMNTWTFTEKDGKTTITLSGMPLNATTEEQATYEAAFEGMNEGFKGTFDQLADYLATL